MESKLTPEQQRDFIANKAPTLNVAGRQEVLQWLCMNIDANLIHEKRDGNRIDLCKIEDRLINDLYFVVKNKISNI